MDSFEYGVGTQVFGMRRNDYRTYRLAYRDRGKPQGWQPGKPGVQLSLVPTHNFSKTPLPPPVKCYGFPPEAGVYFGELKDPRYRGPDQARSL